MCLMAHLKGRALRLYLVGAARELTIARAPQEVDIDRNEGNACDRACAVPSFDRLDGIPPLVSVSEFKREM